MSTGSEDYVNKEDNNQTKSLDSIGNKNKGDYDMSVPRFKRKTSGLEYIDNAYSLQQEIMNLSSKLSARWARIESNQ